MRKICITIVLAFGAAVSVGAQDYTWALGVRLGDDMSGISVKKSIDARNKMEGILAVPYWHGVNFTGLYQRYIPVEAFHIYCGVGGHIGNWKHTSNDISKNYFFLGLDCMVGIEFSLLKSVPLSLSIDYKPSYNLTGHAGFSFTGGGIGLRYRL
ncbi:MAG: hypothetical protein FWE30_06655 [Bacteroidales bacterium]|nr:hypothetical protein [Bacteroidales bacterium]